MSEFFWLLKENWFLFLLLAVMLFAAVMGVQSIVRSSMAHQECISYGYVEAFKGKDGWYCARMVNYSDEVVSLEQLRDGQ